MKILRFLYDFFIGDDWHVAIAVVLGMALTWYLAHHGSAAWFVVPIVLVLTLPYTLWRAIRK